MSCIASNAANSVVETIKLYINFNEWVAHVQLNILMKHKISGLQMRTRDDMRTYVLI